MGLMTMAELANAGGSQRELVAFRVGDQEFCVDIMSVREIRGWVPATPLPQSPSYVRGVINLRGAILPILDLAARFGMASSDATDRHVIIVVQVHHQLVGLLVDGVSDIITIEDAIIQPPPDLVSDRVRAFVHGLLALNERMLGILSLDDILPPLDTRLAA